MAEAPKLSPLVYALYYIILFFAFWFGANRFDVDGDGDFDPEDVQAYLEDAGFVKKIFRRPPSSKKRDQVQQVQVASVEAARERRQQQQQLQQQQLQQQQQRQQGGLPGGLASFFDSDGDGQVSIEDAVFSKVHGATAAEDEMIDNLFLKQRIPWFIIVECVLVFGLWLFFSIKLSMETGKDPLVLQAGLDSIDKGTFVLRISDSDCADYRTEVWRWLTYQFTHIGIMHVVMNVFLNLILGIPLEGFHGSARIFLMYNIGVFGGACAYFLSDSHKVVVGCSGGCYSLIGIHIGDLFMNWSQKKFRIPTLVFLLLLTGLDLLSYFMSMSEDNTSHSAHLGGFVAGVIICILMGKNLKVTRLEIAIMVLASCVGALLTIMSIAWLFAQEEGPLNIFEAMGGQKGWCWVRQLFSTEIDPTRTVCVRCGTAECIEEWSAKGEIASVSLRACISAGFYHDGR